MGNLRKYLELQTQAKTGLSSGLFVWGLLAVVSGILTAAFILLEIDELIRRPTVFKALAFIINVAIVVYLIRRKQLFLDRPPGWPGRADGASRG